MSADISEILEGCIENVVYHNAENDYSVIEINTADGALITAVGIIASPGEGEVVKLKGHYTLHKDFGKQFAFSSYDKSLPKEIEGIIQYLSSRTIKGIGPVTALKIVNRFGTDTFDVIENHPDWLTDIPGITPKKARAISESFCEQSELRNVMIFFKDFIGAQEINRVYKSLGASAVGIVRDNPYILCGGEMGISFDKVDSIAATLGYPQNGKERLISGIEYVLRYNSSMNGHTCLPREKLVEAVMKLLSLGEGIISEAIEYALEDDQLATYNIDGVEYIMTAGDDDREEYTARRLLSMSREVIRIGQDNIAELVYRAEHDMRVSYASLQREAIYRCLESGVSIVTGGPGTGKTTIVKALISVFSTLGIKTVLCAPTGRAAKRLSETTGEEAKTIHRLLEMERTENASVRFNRNSQFPLDEGVVIVDEASMLDLVLINALMRAIPRGGRLVLIGDFDQLPSVGAGNVLADLIGSERIPTVRLTEVFRQSEESLIISNAHSINRGEMPILNAVDRDFFFVRREDERSIASTVASLITERLPRAYGKSIRDDIQVITPSRRGWGGVDTLNLELQAKINPPSDAKKEHTAHSTIFREGDRVMQIVNDYEIEWEKNGYEGIGIFNGDIGTIETINDKAKYMVIHFDDRIVRYDYDKLDELELAYAITVHKSQGSGATRSLVKS